ncbi:unnamed protein product [Arctia plantaginis]|uniref:CCHC-type domain-containing protein n=1 Tax=Arctia plantaginis TaxID=874455 RepID=A0A8S0ZJ40_ARCPL|nr:unnamed protein product [Arctia plantaginis]
MSASEPTESLDKKGQKDRLQLVREGKRTFIYKCSKSELLQLLQEENISFISDSVENLRKTLSEHYKSKENLVEKKPEKQKTKMFMYGDLKIFDGDKWEVFKEQLECFILVNDISDDKKVPLLLTKISPSVFETLNYLCSPHKLSKLSFDELSSKLGDKYAKPLSTALERAAFRKRNQLHNENIEDYVLALRKLAMACQFKDKEDQIKEKFMEGVSSKVVKFELMKTETELSLEKCISLARTVEAALLQTNNNHEMTEVYYSNKGKPKQDTKNKNNNSGQCFCCGKKNHIKADCTLKLKYCSECGQQGHIFRMCPKKQRQANVVETNPGNVKEEEKQVEVPSKDVDKVYIKTYDINSVSKIPPFYLEIKVNGQDISFQLDTGSDVTVMSIKDKSMFLREFQLKKSNILFKNFDQSISRPLGVITDVPIRFKEINKNLNIFIVPDNVPRVIGRDWLHEFKLWPPNIQNSLDIGIYMIQTVADAQQHLKTQFAEVFSPGWGNFKGDVISLKLQQDAKPKCLPVRRIPFALREKVNNEIIRLIENGRITPVEQNEWGTPIVPILKPDGSVRLCGDYKLTINPHLVFDHFHLPHIEDIMDVLKGGEYYCELDLKEAYLQAPLSVESKGCTTIVTELGTFQYNFLPFGMRSRVLAMQKIDYG